MRQTSGSITLDTGAFAAGVAEALRPVFEQLDRTLAGLTSSDPGPILIGEEEASVVASCLPWLGSPDGTLLFHAADVADHLIRSLHEQGYAIVNVNASPSSPAPSLTAMTDQVISEQARDDQWRAH